MRQRSQTVRRNVTGYHGHDGLSRASNPVSGRDVGASVTAESPAAAARRRGTALLICSARSAAMSLEHAGVQVSGDRLRRVPQQRLNVLHRSASRVRDRRSAVPQIVKPDRRKPQPGTLPTRKCPWVVSPTAYPAQAAYQTTASYDSAGELVSSTTPAPAAAPAGATTTDAYDPAGQMLTSDDSDGVTTTWTYTPDGTPPAPHTRAPRRQP